MPEPGAMSYMLSKESYLSDAVGHWYPHLMFHIPKTDAASWGANLDDSPVLFDPREFRSRRPSSSYQLARGRMERGPSKCRTQP